MNSSDDRSLIGAIAKPGRSWPFSARRYVSGLPGRAWRFFRSRRLGVPTFLLFVVAPLSLSYTVETYQLAGASPDVTLRIPNFRVYAALGWFVLFLIVLIPRLQTWRIPNRKDRVEAETEARKTLVQMALGIAVIIGGSHAWLQFQYHINERERELKAAQRTEMTERFAKAVEQLANERLAIRIGAIYALERIVEDAYVLTGPSAESRRTQRNVVELLCAYIRERAPSRGLDTPHKDGDLTPSVGVLRDPVDPPPADIQTALTVIGRRRPDGDAPGARTWQPDRVVQLANTDLRRAYLPNAFLRNADLRGAHLEGAYLSGANLESANLRGAYLAAVQGWFTNFERAVLEEAHLEGAFLKGAKLRHVQLSDQHTKRLVLMGADLTGTSLWRVDLSGSTLEQLDMENAASAHEVTLPPGVRPPLIPATPELELIQAAQASKRR
jgi:hypothetical protein